ncbi:DUF2786 domain-containing protein [Streptomyces sp. NPDC058611]|uniref:DUF2786 domain-containing protein n=1 Tax=unclassified Streptomyces TaxID=2593676 RepID=UPI003647E057
MLEDVGPLLYKLLPADFGEERLVAAVTVARLAADEARAQSVAESVGWLERLIPGGEFEDLEGPVRELRSALASYGEPALWSWNAPHWESMLLWQWRRGRPRSGDPVRDVAGWRARWAADIPGDGDADEPERAPRRHGRELVTPAAFFAGEPEPLGLLARAVLAGPEVAEAVQDVVLLHGEHLQGAGHLEWLTEQQVRIERLDAWRREQQATGSEATRAFLGELSEAGKRYMSLVFQPVVDALSGCERALLADSRSGASRSATDYLSAFLDAQQQPDGEAWEDRRLSAGVQRLAEENTGRGVVTWRGMSGSVPVWYHVVGSREERAAALAYSGQPAPSVVRVEAGSQPAGEFAGLLDDPWAEDAEWYPEPGIGIRYDGQSPGDLCELLALCRLGHARLEFLVPQAEGRFQRLRTLRARIRTDDAASWRRWALERLADIVPDPEDLADALAEEQGMGGGDDLDNDFGLDNEGKGQGPGNGRPRPDGTGPSPEPPAAGPTAARRSAGAGLPAALLEKVRALLRKAESQAVGEEEARAYLDKATELMAKYGIEQAMLDDQTERGGPVDRVVDLHPPYVKEVRRLLAWISSEMRCRSVYPGGKNNKHRVHLFGFEADIQASEVLFSSLRLQMLDGADRAERLHRPAGEDARAYKRSWMLGFIREVAARVGAAQQVARTAAERQAGPEGGEEPASGRSVALVLADRTQVVESRLSAQYPTLKKATPTTFKGTGYHQGLVDGRYADIGTRAFADVDGIA